MNKTGNHIEDRPLFCDKVLIEWPLNTDVTEVGDLKVTSLKIK